MLSWWRWIFIHFCESKYSSFIEFWQAHVQEWLWHAAAGGDGWDEQGGGGQPDQGHNQQCQLDWIITTLNVLSGLSRKSQHY